MFCTSRIRLVRAASRCHIRARTTPISPPVLALGALARARPGIVRGDLGSPPI